MRGKSGRVFGSLVALLTVMKGQPLAYNKDNQEDKEPLFDTVDTLADTLAIMADLVATGIDVDRERMRAAAREGFATATDLADYLVRKGMPFRDATKRRAQCFAEQSRCAGGAAAGRAAPPAKVGKDVYRVLTLEGSVASRSHVGGTAPSRVRAAVKRARATLKRA